MHFVNTLRPGQNDRHIAGHILKCILLNENCRMSIQFSPEVLYFQFSSHQYASIGLDDGLVWNKREVIIITSDGIFSLAIQLY